jgi:hypothetical protein
VPDPIAESYADCIHLRCENCGALPADYCVNPLNQRPRGVPCLARIHDAEFDQAGRQS